MSGVESWPLYLQLPWIGSCVLAILLIGFGIYHTD